MNLAVVSGHLTRPAERRILPSGDSVVGLEVSTPGPASRESVPVAWFDAPAWADTLDVGDELVVVGRVRRRFFRTGGGTQSRTELVAESVVPAGQRKRVAAALDRAGRHLSGATVN